MIRTCRRISLAAAVAAAAVTLSGCQGYQSHAAGSVAEDAHYLSDAMRSRAADSGAQIRAHKTVQDLLPNVAVSRSGRPAEPMTDATVLGRVVNVSKGVGFSVDGEDAPGGTATSFDDPKALWRTVHLTVEVDDDFGQGKWNAATLPVGLVVNPDVDFERTTAALKSHSKVVLFLRKGSKVFGYDPSLYSIVDSGVTFTTVASDGTLSMPFAPEEDAKALLGPVKTLDDLRRESQKPRRVIRFDS